MKILDKSEFVKENYTVYGNIAVQIAMEDYHNIIGYNYQTTYDPLENWGGVMFHTKRGPKWTHVPIRLIKEMEEKSEGKIC